MADGSGGDFDGDGSVRWQVVVEEDDDRKGQSVPDGPGGRRTSGVEKRCKTYFRVLMKAPADPHKRRAFLAQFNVPEDDGVVEVRLPIDKVSKQIQVKWDCDGPIDWKDRPKK
jgi:hypothetical protein